MKPSKNSLIFTKLQVPARRARLVQRACLVQKMAVEPGIDLLLVCAPAGYGKTTLLIEWAHQLEAAGVAVAWYALDESDNSPVTFGTYLVASLERILEPTLGLETISQMLRSSPEIDLLQLLPAVINALFSSGRSMVLVLDDYHLISSPQIHEAIEFLVTHLPEHVHIAIGSRMNPPLPLARWRAKGKLIEIRAADLRFSEEETGQFLQKTMGVDLPGDLAKQLAVKVEGWAAGLQLAALSLSNRSDPHALISSFTGRQKHLADYLLDEVANQLPEEAQSFLLYTSILERMSAPLCDAVLEVDGSARWLRELEENNLFVAALDEEGIWYRYHHLFRDFLQTWLNRTQPDRASALHRAASDWFSRHGLLREAAHHAFQSGDEVFAANFVEQHSFSLIIQSEIATIYDWCSRFPEVFMQTRPKLCILQSMALAYQFRARNRARVEARLRQAEEGAAAIEDAEQSLEVDQLAAVVRTFLSMIPDPGVDVRELLNLAKTHLANHPPDDAACFPWLLISGYALLALHQVEEAEKVFNTALPFATRLGLFFGAVEISFHLARLAYSQGKLADSLSISREGLANLAAALNQSPVDLPALGCLDVAIGSILLEQDRLEEAERSLTQGMDRMGWGMNPYYLMTGCLARFRLYSAQRRLNAANTCLDQLEMMWPDIQFLTEGLRIQAELRIQPSQAAVERACAWLQWHPSSSGDHLHLAGLGPIGSAEVIYQANLVWVWLNIATGNINAVWPYLKRQTEIEEEYQITGRVIELTLLEAQAYQKKGEQALALASLEKALRLAGREGYIRVFDQSELLDDLIHMAAQKGLQPEKVDPILAAIRSAKRLGIKTEVESLPCEDGQRQPLQDLPEPLSERELEVLRLMAEGATNQGIASRLVITIGTVKSHINHILSKLNAANRTEAVAKARDLGLLG
ncbi:hypothetical protein ADN00_16280 [Ornatilinea apprima]|uniref:HTH luxR-type domain-containing protein n=2 Tax=Ornatilinea apprima TaxID=1134406 RepID=A0A0N8GLB6_9CHLR|nr:hypothetical protein ADN00_16280 [Ornatilinea apprima]